VTPLLPPLPENRPSATQVYLPLSRLLYLHVSATQSVYRATHAFLAAEEKEVPYVVGIAGSVAAGKSTVARVLRALISRWLGRPEVGLVSTDGFLYPNHVLRSRGLMDRKGFPETYNLPLLLKEKSRDALWRGKDQSAPGLAIDQIIVPGRSRAHTANE
jgi:type I pantothenate kinase